MSTWELKYKQKNFKNTTWQQIIRCISYLELWTSTKPQKDHILLLKLNLYQWKYEAENISYSNKIFSYHLQKLFLNRKNNKIHDIPNNTVSLQFLFEINLTNLDKFCQAKRSKAFMLQLLYWTEAKLSRNIHTTLLVIYKNTIYNTAFQTYETTKKKNRKKYLWGKSTKWHVQIKTDSKNILLQALLKI